MNTGAYAVVTGAASGMGLEYTKILKNMGYGIIAVDIKGIEDPETITINADLSDAKGIENAIQQIDALGMDIEILVNNAGIFSYKHIEDQSEEYIQKICMLHNVCMARFCRHFIPQMEKRGKGYILNISSLAAWMPFPGIALYSATKSFTLAFSRALNTELRSSGVSVTSACFGAVATPLLGLGEKYTRLALRLHVMITAKQAVECAIKAMFKRKAKVIPGMANKIGKPLLGILPERLKGYADRKLASVRNH